MARSYFDRLTKSQFEEIKSFIEDLDLIPSQFITDEVIKIWRTEVFIEHKEKVIDLIHKDEVQDLMERFYRRNTNRGKRVSEDGVNVQLRINFD